MPTRMFLSMIVIAGALTAPRSAAAEIELVVLGPVPAAPRISVAAVQKVLDKGEVAPRNAKAIDAACALDVSCLVAAGTELSARRVLAISVGRTTEHGVLLNVVLVDVGGSDLLSRRQLTLHATKLLKDLGPALKKFVTEAPVERAKALFAKGNEHYNLGEFVQALDQYRRAYRAKALPAFLFNIAQCHRKLGQHADAVTMYQSYLVGVPNAQNKALVESLITESRAELATEEKAAASAEQARRDANRIAAEKQKAEAMRRAREAEAQAEAERTKAARIAADRALYNTHPARTWAIVGGSIGAIAVIGGGVFGMRARAAQTSFDNAGCGDPGRPLEQTALAQCIDDRDRGKRDATFANIFIGGGAALLLVATAVIVIDPGNVERPEEPRAKVSISPTSVQLVVKW